MDPGLWNGDPPYTILLGAISEDTAISFSLNNQFDHDHHWQSIIDRYNWAGLKFFLFFLRCHYFFMKCLWFTHLHSSSYGRLHFLPNSFPTGWIFDKCPPWPSGKSWPKSAQGSSARNSSCNLTIGAPSNGFKGHLIDTSNPPPSTS